MKLKHWRKTISPLSYLRFSEADLRPLPHVRWKLL